MYTQPDYDTCLTDRDRVQTYSVFCLQYYTFTTAKLCFVDKETLNITSGDDEKSEYLLTLTEKIKNTTYKTVVYVNDKRCIKCGFVWHFREHCRTSQKRQFSNYRNRTVNKKPRTNTKKESDKSKIDYIFHLDDDRTIKCNIGGVIVDMLIDSGSKCITFSSRIYQHIVIY